MALWAPNSPEWILAVLGLFQAGAVLVPVNTRFKGVEAGDILARSGARALVTVTDFLGTDHLGLLRTRAPTCPTCARSWSPPGRRPMAPSRGPRSWGGRPRPAGPR